jgi:hypothetical protein
MSVYNIYIISVVRRCLNFMLQLKLQYKYFQNDEFFYFKYTHFTLSFS